MFGLIGIPSAFSLTVAFDAWQPPTWAEVIEFQLDDAGKLELAAACATYILEDLIANEKAIA